MTICTDLGDRGGENYNLVELANPLHELVDTRSFDNVNVVVLSFYLNRNRKVCLM